MLVSKTALLFARAAFTEILGCYFCHFWLGREGTVRLLLPSALCLAIFARALTLHPAASGRTYAAYGGV